MTSSSELRPQPGRGVGLDPSSDTYSAYLDGTAAFAAQHFCGMDTKSLAGKAVLAHLDPLLTSYWQRVTCMGRGR